MTTMQNARPAANGTGGEQRSRLATILRPVATRPAPVERREAA